MPELIIQSGKHQGKKLVLPDADVIVGRDDDCQIRLATNDVSRKHCIIRSTPEGLVLRDLGSRNGTLVNDVRVEQERLLLPGDRVRIGPILLEVPHARPSQPAAAPSAAVKSGPSASVHSDSVGDDEIASWLTEGDEIETGTTTIVRATLPAQTESDSSDEIEVPSDHDLPKTDPEIAKKKKFKSIAEEAAHIIGRWKELAAREDE
jgi:pSer/pThr/pTyr-binding forkhead associated (FHA) protein